MFFLCLVRFLLGCLFVASGAFVCLLPISPVMLSACGGLVAIGAPLAFFLSGAALAIVAAEIGLRRDALAYAARIASR